MAHFVDKIQSRATLIKNNFQYGLTANLAYDGTARLWLAAGKKYSMQ